MRLAAGDAVELSIELSNTGNVTLQDVVLQVSSNFQSTLACTPVVASPMLLQPGAVVQCTASYTPDLDEFEAGDLAGTVTAEAAATSLWVSKNLAIASQWRPEVKAEVMTAQRSVLPAKAGERVCGEFA